MRISRQALGRTGVVCGWALVAGMSGIGLNRLFRAESQPQMIGLQAVGMWFLIPAYPVALLAMMNRKRALATVAAVLAIGNAVWVSELYETGPEQAAPTGAAQLPLVAANIQNTNQELTALADDLTATGADVLVLQEVTPDHLQELVAAGLLVTYPYHVLDPHTAFHGSAILSKLPIANGRAIDVAGLPMTRADISTSAGPVRIINVHTAAPVSETGAGYWHAQFRRLAQMANEYGGPLVMAGDFNATADHEPMCMLLSSGMRDAFSEVGNGIGATWPQWAGPIFPVMRIDHVLVNNFVAALRAQVQPNRGSDHRRLSVELAVPINAAASGPGAAPWTPSIRPSP